MPQHMTCLSQGLSIGTHVCEDDQHMLLQLVGHELSSGEGQARRDDTLDSGDKRRGEIEREEESDQSHGSTGVVARLTWGHWPG